MSPSLRATRPERRSSARTSLSTARVGFARGQCQAGQDLAPSRRRFELQCFSSSVVGFGGSAMLEKFAGFTIIAGVVLAFVGSAPIHADNVVVSQAWSRASPK